MPGATKYSSKEGFSNKVFKDLQIPSNIKKILIDSNNYALSNKTKKSYQSALNRAKLCETETKCSFSCPMTEKDLLVFVGWAISKDNKASTIRTYLCGLKNFHIAMGFKNFTTDFQLIKNVLRGHENKTNEAEKSSKKSKSRLPCTPYILRLIKAELKISAMPKSDKIVIWAAVTAAFAGGMRMGELLCKSDKVFDKNYDLLKKDVKLCSDNTLQISVKSSKCNKSNKAELIEIFPSDSKICAVAAYKKLEKVTKNLPNNTPCFSNKEGTPLTCRALNKFLKSFSSKHFKKGVISGHSMRAGLVSIFGQLGYTDAELKKFGRWSSRAFTLYTKLARTRRHEMAKAAKTIS